MTYQVRRYIKIDNLQKELDDWSSKGWCLHTAFWTSQEACILIFQKEGIRDCST